MGRSAGASIQSLNSSVESATHTHVHHLTARKSLLIPSNVCDQYRQASAQQPGPVECVRIEVSQDDRHLCD